MAAILYIVSTPIGNLEDITLRALRTLKEADVVAAEDTRHTLKLLTHYGIKKPLISYWGEKEKVKAEEVIRRLQSGQSVALVTDAGTPGISDPGTVLIRRAVGEGFDVVSIPGPSSVISALSVSGLPTEEFTFVGFLPQKSAQRRKRLEELSLEPRTMVFFEAPHRIVETLIDMEAAFGRDRKGALVKELTKMHEEVLRGALGDILDRLKDAKIAGEYIIVVRGREKAVPSFDEALFEVKSLMKAGMGRKEAAGRVAAEYGLSKKELYDRSLKQ